MNAITYRREPLMEWLPQARPLIEAHWLEVGRDREKIALAPDFPKWLQLERMGAALGFTARAAGGELAGYAVFLLSQALDYRDHTFAVQASLYLAPEHRRGWAASGFIKFMVGELKAGGASRIQMVSPAASEHDFGVLLHREGFGHVENVHELLVI